MGPFYAALAPDAKAAFDFPDRLWQILDILVNGAILGAVVGLVYAVVTWIAISIRYPGFAGLAYRWGIGSLLRVIVEGCIGGAFGAAGWYAYKTGAIKTK